MAVFIEDEGICVGAWDAVLLTKVATGAGAEVQVNVPGLPVPNPFGHLCFAPLEKETKTTYCAAQQ